MKYYTCEACRFQFVRHGEIIQCPDCGKESIRESTDDEIADFIRTQEELKREFNK